MIEFEIWKLEVGNWKLKLKLELEVEIYEMEMKLMNEE